jgi:hypothetical protein
MAHAMAMEIPFGQAYFGVVSDRPASGRFQRETYVSASGTFQREVRSTQLAIKTGTLVVPLHVRMPVVAIAHAHTHAHTHTHAHAHTHIHTHTHMCT